MSKVVYEGWMVRYGRRKIGRSYIHMRYFVLESRLIAYYKRKPLDNVFPIKTLLIDGNCRVEDHGLKTQHEHPSFPTPFQQAQTSQTRGANGIDGVTKVGGQSTSAQQYASFLTSYTPSPELNNCLY